MEAIAMQVDAPVEHVPVGKARPVIDTNLIVLCIEVVGEQNSGFVDGGKTGRGRVPSAAHRNAAGENGSDQASPTERVHVDALVDHDGE